jgi:uncharacterized protein (TIGR02246 family)
MRSRCILVVVVAMLLTESFGIVRARTSSDSTEQISAIHNEWVKDWKTKNLEDLRMLYAQDAVFLPAVGRYVQGRDAIAGYLKELIDSSTDGLIVDSWSTQASENVAYDNGAIQYWLRGNGGPMKGYYVTVLKRNSEGRWVIACQAFTEIDTRNSSIR